MDNMLVSCSTDIIERLSLASYLQFLLRAGGGRSPWLCRCWGDLTDQASALGCASSHESSKKLTKLSWQVNGDTSQHA